MNTPTKKQNTLVIKLLALAWSQAHTGHRSWRRLNASLSGLLRVAINQGWRFERQDFQTINLLYRPQYWMGLHGGRYGGYLYTQAVCNDGSGRVGPVHNLSAAQAIEQWWQMKPWIRDGRRLAVGSRVRLTHDSKDAPLGGFRYQATVTNVAPERIIICAHNDDGRVMRRWIFNRRQFRRALLVVL